MINFTYTYSNFEGKILYVYHINFTTTNIRYKLVTLSLKGKKKRKEKNAVILIYKLISTLHMELCIYTHLIIDFST